MATSDKAESLEDTVHKECPLPPFSYDRATDEFISQCGFRYQPFTKPKCPKYIIEHCLEIYEVLEE